MVRVHWGAIEFDRQAGVYAHSHYFATWVIKPGYGKYGHQAPLIRDVEIAAKGELLVAL